MRRDFLFGFGALLFVACQPVSRLPQGFSTCEAPPFTLPDRPITYFEDIKPILDGRCVECHTLGGIGPFPLTNYNAAEKRKDIIPASVQSREMPPWPPDDCCASYENKRSLTDEQIALITEWSNQGAIEGDPALEGAPLEPVTIDLPRIDATVAMPEPFEPQGSDEGSSELRCFLLDWPFAEETFVTGFNVRPGNPSVVHHIALLTLNNEDSLEAEIEDAKDDRLGFDCHTFDLELNPTGSIGSWGPGYRSVLYPEGIGLRAPAGSRLLMQVHYDIDHTSGLPDQTAVDFMVEDSVENSARILPVGNPLWIVDDAMLLKANEEDVMYNFSYDPTILFNRPKGFRIFGVNLHMHELGTGGSLAILRKDGSTECLMHTTRWDFDWLGEYQLSEPVDIFPGDELYVECHWSTLGLSEDLGWGDDEEMCGGLLSAIELE